MARRKAQAQAAGQATAARDDHAFTNNCADEGQSCSTSRAASSCQEDAAVSDELDGMVNMCRDRTDGFFLTHKRKSDPVFAGAPPCSSAATQAELGQFKCIGDMQHHQQRSAMDRATRPESNLRTLHRHKLKPALVHLHERTIAYDQGNNSVFLEPVSTKIAPHYYQLIKAPMDLSTIGDKVHRDAYHTAWDYMQDMWLMFSNALFFNRIGSFHNRYTLKMRNWWIVKAEAMMLTDLAPHHYCCGRIRELSPESFRCRGGTCFIQPGSTYWYLDLDQDEQLIFCHAHFQKLPHRVTMTRYGNGTGGEISFDKSQLKKTKYEAQPVQERFVFCSECGRADHEICVMYDAYGRLPYVCRDCGGFSSPAAVLGAIMTQHSQLSASMSSASLKTAGLSQQGFAFESEAVATSAGHSVLELPSPHCHIGLRAQNLVCSALASDISAEIKGTAEISALPVLVRTVNHGKEVGEIKANLKARHPEIDRKLPYTRKEVLLFYNFGPYDMCFFSVFVYEYGADCPQPNHLRIYISLLDSVKLPVVVLPSTQRTALYHAVLRGILRHAGRRGFEHAHIYTCPPRRGQSYIFPFKPDIQKEISLTRLRSWYIRMLDDAMFRSDPAVVSYHSLTEAFPLATISQLPYFDGDNWPDLIEDIIRLDDKAVQEDPLRQRAQGIVHLTLQSGHQLRKRATAQASKPRTNALGYEGKPFQLAAVDLTMKGSTGTALPKSLKQLTVNERLRLVMDKTQKDFLVVQLLNKGCETFEADPDAGRHGFGSTGENHSLVSFFKAERLEFSSLRHATYSTMVLLRFLMTDNKEEFSSRWPD